MSLSADIQQCSSCSQVPAAESICLWAGTAFTATLGKDAEVTIRIVDEDEGAALNQKYRNGVGATNVLSFTYAGDPYIQRDFLGDIVICAPIVKREALAQNKGMDAHWAHMVVHGILHLCGYEHDDEQDADRMERLETEILSELGFPTPYN